MATTAFKRPPVIDLTGWRRVHADAAQAVYRPGFPVLLHRIGWVLLAGALFVSLYPVYRALAMGPPSSPVHTPDGVAALRRLEAEVARDLQESMSPEAWQSLQDRIEASRAVRQAERDRHELQMARARWGFKLVFGAVAALLAALAVVPPLSLLWNRLTLERHPRGDLVVRTCLLVPRRHQWYREEVDRMLVVAREHITHSRRGGMRQHGWRWHVCLLGPPETAGGPGESRLPPRAEFIVHRERHRPTDGMPPPDAVADFARTLAYFAQVAVPDPVILDTEVEVGLLSRRVRYRGQQPLVGQSSRSWTASTVDELPEDVRPAAQRLMAQARDVGGGVRRAEQETFVIRDAQGREQTYRSLEEMPPEVRAVYERLRRGE